MLTNFSSISTPVEITAAVILLTFWDHNVRAHTIAIKTFIDLGLQVETYLPLHCYSLCVGLPY